MARNNDERTGQETDFAGQPNEGQSGKPSPETVEKLAKRLEVSAPVFAAVMQMQGWASGKTVSEDEFKKAVEAFLGAPISGVKTPEGEKK
jgi:hypothetical protein